MVSVDFVGGTRTVRMGLPFVPEGACIGDHAFAEKRKPVWRGV